MQICSTTHPLDITIHHPNTPWLASSQQTMPTHSPAAPPLDAPPQPPPVPFACCPVHLPPLAVCCCVLQPRHTDAAQVAARTLLAAPPAPAFVCPDFPQGTSAWSCWQLSFLWPVALGPASSESAMHISRLQASEQGSTSKLRAIYEAVRANCEQITKAVRRQIAKPTALLDKPHLRLSRLWRMWVARIWAKVNTSDEKLTEALIWDWPEPYIYVRCVYSNSGRAFIIYGHLQRIHTVLANPDLMHSQINVGWWFQLPGYIILTGAPDPAKPVKNSLKWTSRQTGTGLYCNVAAAEL